MELHEYVTLHWGLHNIHRPVGKEMYIDLGDMMHVLAVRNGGIIRVTFRDRGHKFVITSYVDRSLGYDMSAKLIDEMSKHRTKFGHELTMCMDGNIGKHKRREVQNRALHIINTLFGTI